MSAAVVVLQLVNAFTSRLLYHYPVYNAVAFIIRALCLNIQNTYRSCILFAIFTCDHFIAAKNLL